MASILSSCSTSSRFRTSRPVEETRFIEEAMLLCHEYRLPTPADRPESLDPMVNCVNRAREKHELNKEHPVSIFAEELTQIATSRKNPRIEGENPWSPQLGRNLELATHALLRAMWRSAVDSGTFLAGEKEAALKHFPETTAALQAEQWETGQPVPRLDPELESLKAAFSGTISAQKEEVKKRPAPPACGAAETRQLALRGRISELKEDILELDRTWAELQNLAGLDGSQKLGRSLQESYGEDLWAAIQELEHLRAAFAP